MVPTSTWKDRTDFPYHRMTALEIHSMVVPCKYSNWQWLIKDKHKRSIDYLNATKLSVPRTESRRNTLSETDAAAGSKKPGASDSLIPGLRINIFPQKNFDISSKARSLWRSLNKGTKQTVCV